jgi:hypothetical protein
MSFVLLPIFIHSYLPSVLLYYAETKTDDPQYQFWCQRIKSTADQISCTFQILEKIDVY